MYLLQLKQLSIFQGLKERVSELKGFNSKLKDINKFSIISLANSVLPLSLDSKFEIHYNMIDDVISIVRYDNGIGYEVEFNLLNANDWQKQDIFDVLCNDIFCK